MTRLTVPIIGLLLLTGCVVVVEEERPNRVCREPAAYCNEVGFSTGSGYLRDCINLCKYH